MKNYQCHKKVQASQIVKISETFHPDEPETQMVEIHLEDITTLVFQRNDKALARYMPVAGAVGCCASRQASMRSKSRGSAPSTDCSPPAPSDS